MEPELFPNTDMDTGHAMENCSLASWTLSIPQRRSLSVSSKFPHFQWVETCTNTASQPFTKFATTSCRRTLNSQLDLQPLWETPRPTYQL